MRFLIDAQLPPALVEALAGIGHEAVHIAAVGLASAPDGIVWSYASQISAIILTKDQDFVTMRHSADSGPAIVWIRFGNATTRHLKARLLPKFPEIICALEAGEMLVEVR